MVVEADIADNHIICLRKSVRFGSADTLGFRMKKTFSTMALSYGFSFLGAGRGRRRGLFFAGFMAAAGSRIPAGVWNSGLGGERRSGGLREFRRRRPRRGWSLGTAAWHRPGARRETALRTRTRRKKLPIPRRNRELLADKQLRRQPRCSRRESQPRESREPQWPHRSRWSARRSSPAPGRTRRGSAGRWGSGCPSGRRS